MHLSAAKAFEWLKWLLLSAVTPAVALWKLIRLRIHQVHVIEKIDGPRAYPFVGNAMGPRTFSARDIYLYFKDLSDQYGKTFRYYLGPLPFVYTMETKDLESILSGQKYIEKNFMYKLLRPWLGTGLLTSGGEKWRHRRKLLTPAFHFKILEQFVPVFNSCGEEFVRQLRRRADGKVFDVYPLVELLTLDVICGHVIPEGCSISIAPYSTHRDPEVFPDPESFIPERFSPEESARRHPFAYIPFSAGPRNCIGQRFAILELKSLLAKVVWNFRILPAPDFEPELTWELTLKSQNGVQVRLEERRPN